MHNRLQQVAEAEEVGVEVAADRLGDQVPAGLLLVTMQTISTTKISKYLKFSERTVAGDQQEAVVEEERKNGAEVSFLLSKTEICPMEAVLRSKKIKESQINFLLRCKDGGSCSRRSLRGLPDGKVHWKVGFLLSFLSFLFCAQIWPLGARWRMGDEGVQHLEGEGWNAVQVLSRIEFVSFKLFIWRQVNPRLYLDGPKPLVSGL